MKIQVTADELRVEFTSAEKLLALHGDIVVPRSAIFEADVVEDPIRAYRERAGRHLAMGLRLPYRRYLCATDRRRRFWAISRSVPALRVVYEVGGRRELILSTADASAQAAELAG